MENSQIASNLNDSNEHIERQCDSGTETGRKSQCQNENGNHLMQSQSSSLESATNTNNLDENPLFNLSDNLVIQSNRNDKNNDRSVADDVPNPVLAIQSQSGINIDQITHAMIPKAIDRIFRTVQRISHELQIVADLERLVKEHNFNAKVVPFGSSTYGFGGTNTDFNICLLNDGHSNQANTSTVFESFVKSIEEETTTSFKVRAAFKNRMTAVHKASGILCVVQSEVDANKIEASRIIRDCLMQAPICYHLIAFIRAWQDTLAQAAAQNGTSAPFQFNTYIISVLVIFFYQIDQKFPKVSNVPSLHAKSIDIVPHVNGVKFKRAIGQFFQFYGKICGLNHKIISLNIGRLENRYLIERQPINETPEQKRLRDGIKSNVSNWWRCSMLIEDIKSPGINITADVPEKDVKNFIEMCQLFESISPYERAIDEYLMKVQQIQPARVIDLTLDVEPPPTKRAALDTHRKSSTDIPSNSSATQTLTNVILTNIKQVFQEIPNIAVDLTSRNARRIAAERDIVACLKPHFNTYSTTLQSMIFGSATYGFGGPNTDFNILINTDSTENQLVRTIIQALGKVFEMSGHFEFLDRTYGNRVQKSRLKVYHKDTDILCWMHFGASFQLAETSQIIRNCILQAPICYHLIAYVRSWQEALNGVAALKEMCAFQFNTYIISVLVIFYLQLKHNLPKLANVQATPATSIDHVPPVDKHQLKHSIRHFFEFYGQFYDLKNQLISVHIGQWECRQLNKNQSDNHLTPEQKRLRDGMQSHYSNWRNCTMFVEDLNVVGRNIMAEIPPDQAHNFKEMCKLFAFMDLHEQEQAVDLYLLKLSQVRNASKNCTVFNNPNQDVGLIENRLPSTSVADVRKLFEMDIFTVVAQYIHELDPTLKLFPFGSTQYGFTFPNTNFNLLITTDQIRPEQVSHWFLFKFGQCNIVHHFKELHQIRADRVMNSQISMTHIKSGIQCVIAFDRDHTIIQSTDILKRFTTDPLCNYLIRSVRSRVQRADVQSFNTYIISILVLFFLQVKHHFPTAGQCLVVTSTNSDFRPALKQFYNFYVNNYQMPQHVISADIGQFQELHNGHTKKKNKPEKLRLRCGIQNNPQNWRNCKMYVQDLVRPHVNATAEVSANSADNFRRMCRSEFQRLKNNS